MPKKYNQISLEERKAALAELDATLAQFRELLDKAQDTLEYMNERIEQLGREQIEPSPWLEEAYRKALKVLNQGDADLDAASNA